MSIFMIDAQEKRYEENISKVINSVNQDPKKRVVLVTGPSCAGKTTTTRKLSEGFAKSGRKVIVVSLDDFYLNYVDVPERPDGTKDLETIYSLDLNYIHSFLADLLSGKTAYLPKYSFVKKNREEEYTPIKMETSDVILIEGLHALNPLIYEGFVDKESIIRVYLYTESPYDFDPRFIRRMVRDYFHRGTSGQKTFEMWSEVRKGEELYIDPFIEYADHKINTFFTFEENVHAAAARNILSEISEDSKYYGKAQRLLRSLEDVEPVDFALIPKKSLLREFMKDCYE